MPFEGAERLVENRIREAIESGQFKNLPGAGRPLQLDEPDSLHRDMWLANHLLRNNKALPPWIELAKEIDAAGDRAEALWDEYAGWLTRTRASLAAAAPAEVERRRPGVAATYARYFERYRQQLRELQAMKQRFNYLVPVRSLEKGWPPLDHALDRVRAQFRAVLGAYFAVLPADPRLTHTASAPAPVRTSTALPRGPRARRRLLRRIADVANLMSVAR
jgi:hypothetical protein